MKLEERRQSQKEHLKAITDGIEKGIQELFESEKYKQYLRTMSRFPRYSLNNTILIFLQNPNATLVAGFQRWQEEFERHVRKGEKGIKIIAPTPYKTKKDIEKLDPVTRMPIKDITGKVLTEEVELKIPMFKPVTVFDVSQTEGKPLPELVSSLEGNVYNYPKLIEALRRTYPVTIAFEEMKASTDGYFSPLEQRIAIRSGMSEVQTISATIHEIAHSLLHNKNLEPAQTLDHEQIKVLIKNQRTKEVEAESVSYTVCAYYGIETNENSFGYIASWSKDKELLELKASLELINQTANQLITEVDTYLVEMQKEMMDQREALYVLDDIIYLQIQQSDDGYDYTFFEKESKHELDGGQLDDPSLTILEAREEILAFHELSPERMEEVNYKLLEDMETANEIISRADSYRILQLNREENLRNYRFESLERLEEMGLQVDEMNYHEVYEGIFHDEATTNERLHAIYQQFNFNPPKEFTGHCLSVSDIIALQEHKVVSYYYVDSIGFQKLLGFHAKINPLFNLEDSVEQNDNNLNGIINNLPTMTVMEVSIEQSQTLLMQEQMKKDDIEQKEKKKSIREKLQPSVNVQTPKKSIELIAGRKENEPIHL